MVQLQAAKQLTCSVLELEGFEDSKGSDQLLAGDGSLEARRYSSTFEGAHVKTRYRLKVLKGQLRV